MDNNPEHQDQLKTINKELNQLRTSHTELLTACETAISILTEIKEDYPLYTKILTKIKAIVAKAKTNNTG